MNLSKQTYILIGIAILMFLCPHIARADMPANLFDVSDTDVAKRVFIDYIGGKAVGGTVSAFGPILSIFNGGVLLLAGVYMFYTFIVGTAQGAHDGNFLGKRWSSMWIPVRMLVGATLAFPSLAGGLCIAQWLVLLLSIQGIGFANTVWSSYVTNVATGGVANSLNSEKPYMIARQMYLNNVCAGLFSKYAKDGGPGSAAEKSATMSLMGSSYVDVRQATNTTDGLSRSILYSLEGPLSDGINNDVCGSATFTAKTIGSSPGSAGEAVTV